MTSKLARYIGQCCVGADLLILEELGADVTRVELCQASKIFSQHVAVTVGYY